MQCCRNAGHFADGGVVANNPTLAAIAFLERAYGVERQNMAVLSLGCGSVTGALDVGQDAGGLGWAKPLLTQVGQAHATPATEMLKFRPATMSNICC